MFGIDDALFSSLAIGGILGAAGLGSSIGLGVSAQQASERAARMQVEEAARQFDSNMAWQREQYQRSQDFITRMSNTAHQREVEDLQAAGLNPILSAGGSGASTTSPSSPSSAPTALASIPDPAAGYTVMQRGISSALDTASLAAQRFGDAAASLSKASQNDAITGPLKQKILAEMQSASSMAEKLSSEARSLDALTPARRAYLNGMADYMEHRGYFDWWNFGVNSAKGLSHELRGWSSEIRRWKRGATQDVIDIFRDGLGGSRLEKAGPQPYNGPYFDDRFSPGQEIHMWKGNNY